jgi:hypothetical protein
MTTMIDQEDEVTQFVDDEDVIDEVEVPVEDVLVGPQGNTTFTTRDLPWMKLGPRIDAAVPMEEATKLGGLNFDVELKPLVYRNGDRLVEIPSRRAVIRTNPEMFFAVASDDYQPVQFSEAFSFLDEINPLVSSAGALSGGKKGFMVVQVPGAEKLSVEIDGEVDPHDMYVIVQTSHDLSKAIEIAVMPLRLKCMNMLGLPSLTRDAPQRWSIKHIGDVKRKMHEARQLSSVRVDDDSINVVLKMVLPDKPRREEQITAIKSAFHTSEFVSDGGGSNGWDLLNAVSEYFQWGRTTATRTPQSLFTSGINGDTYRAISRTSQLLLARA